LITEIFISFLVIFGVFTSLVYYYRNYKKPMGLTYNNVWVINLPNPVLVPVTKTIFFIIAMFLFT